MRLELTLRPTRGRYKIPINYNYPLSSVFYRIFSYGSPEFATWLHDNGFINQKGKPLKLFNFSRIFFSNYKIDGNCILASGQIKIVFSSPLGDSIIPAFINGILNTRTITIANNEIGAKFKIHNVIKIDPPTFLRDMKYLALNPIISSIVKENESGKKIIHFLRPEEPELTFQLKKNLLEKYLLIYKEKYNELIHLKLDRDYIDKVGGFSKITKLITIKEGEKTETKVKGFICPVEISASQKMQKIVYDCGLGERNSMGFGMVDLIRTKQSSP